MKSSCHSWTYSFDIFLQQNCGEVDCSATQSHRTLVGQSFETPPEMLPSLTHVSLLWGLTPICHSPTGSDHHSPTGSDSPSHWHLFIFIFLAQLCGHLSLTGLTMCTSSEADGKTKAPQHVAKRHHLGIPQAISLDILSFAKRQEVSNILGQSCKYHVDWKIG